MPLVMGTAGHIDHGKTSLVQRLTGIDCDRLQEEKRRGITIELGFAFCDLPNGGKLGIVDVPGHEKFVKHMVAGASGIDFVMLVIAADEGVMPQTREHLEICSLLGIKHGLVALTKIDLVDSDWLELAKEDVQSFLKGSFLEDAPIFPVSAHTDAGIPALRQYILNQETQLQPKRRTDLFRLPIDRIFSLKGHGTVITGTLLSGQVHVGDTIEILPQGLETKVRSVQSHGQNENLALAGKRTAINLASVEVNDLERGQVLALPNTLFAATRWLIKLHCLPSTPRSLRHRSEIHFHHGACEVLAKIYFYDRDKLAPGETTLAQVRLSQPLVGVLGDSCVLRSFSPLRTVAGGVVINPLDFDLKRQSATPELIAQLLSLPDLPETQAEALVLTQISLYKTGINFNKLSILTNLDSKKLDKILQHLSSQNKIFCFDRENKAYLNLEAVQSLSEHCLATAQNFHRKEPLKPGLARGGLVPAVSKHSLWNLKLPPKLIHFIIERLLKAGELVHVGEVLALKTHSISLKSADSDLQAKLLAAHVQAGLTPPNLKDVLENLHIDPKVAAPVLKLLCDQNQLVKIKDGLYYHTPILEQFKKQVKDWFTQHDDLDANGFRQIQPDLSRKYIIAILEYFDKEKLTIRVGDKRQLRG